MRRRNQAVSGDGLKGGEILEATTDFDWDETEVDVKQGDRFGVLGRDGGFLKVVPLADAGDQRVFKEAWDDKYVFEPWDAMFPPEWVTWGWLKVVAIHPPHPKAKPAARKAAGRKARASGGGGGSKASRQAANRARWAAGERW